MVDVSVVVVTYNPKNDVLFSTLESVICQRNVNYEIIIADDGSKEFDRVRVEDWFKKNNFSNYELVLNKVNQGTLLNALSGWSKANGKYIKQLSPGDFLYCDITLHNAFEIAMKENADIVFGPEAAYTIENDKIVLTNYINPRDLIPYENKDIERIKKNYIEKKDFINGMACLAKADKLIMNAQQLAEKVKYGEDCTYLLMVANDAKIVLMKDFMIWYEFGNGVSTTKSNIWIKRLSNDIRNCYKIIGETHKKYRYMHYLISDYPDSNIISRVFFKALRIVYLSKIQKYKAKAKEKSKIVFDKTPDITILESLMYSNCDA